MENYNLGIHHYRFLCTFDISMSSQFSCFLVVASCPEREISALVDWNLDLCYERNTGFDELIAAVETEK